MGYDNLTFTAAIVNLAVKGHLKIDSVDSKIGHALKGLFNLDIGGTYELHKQASRQPLAPGEAAIMEKLLRGQEETAIGNPMKFLALISGNKRFDVYLAELADRIALFVNPKALKA